MPHAPDDFALFDGHEEGEELWVRGLAWSWILAEDSDQTSDLEDEDVGRDQRESALWMCWNLDHGRDERDDPKRDSGICRSGEEPSTRGAGFSEPSSGVRDTWRTAMDGTGPRPSSS